MGRHFSSASPDDDAFFPEGEKPRYLLPEGCGDLIDLLRANKAEAELPLMYFFDSEGKSLGPPLEIPPSESVPNALAALPHYVERLFQGTRANTSLTIGSARWRYAVSLLRAEGVIELFYIGNFGLAPEREAKIQTFAERHALSPDPRHHLTDPEHSNLAYFLPSAPEAVTSLFREFLVECLGIEPQDTLEFDILAFD